MHANNLIVDNGGTRQTIEGITKLLPHFDRETSTTLIVKTIDAIDAGAFVIPAEQKEIFGVFDFVSKQKTNHFQ